MFTPEVQQYLDEIAVRWNAVEGHLKRTERIRLEVVINAINELRYGGRIVVDAIAIAGDQSLSTDEKCQQLAKKLEEVKNNCIRAHADATDALVLFYHGHLAMNVEEIGLSIVMTHFPQYSQMAAKIKEINLFMANSREERFSRQDIYERINAEHLPALEALYDQMTAVSDALLQELNERRRREEGNSFFSKYGFYTTAAGALLGLLGIYAALAAYRHWWPFTQ